MVGLCSVYDPVMVGGVGGSGCSIDGAQISVIGLVAVISIGCVGLPPAPPAEAGTGATLSLESSSADAASLLDSSGGAPEPVCGNGTIEADEVCDDGNVVDGDGCGADCLVADCLVPITHPTVQAGLDDPGCPTVWVLAGTYTEQLGIDRDVALRETDSGEVVIDAAGLGRPVTVTAGSVVLGRLRLTGGLAADGGGVHSTTNLTLEGTEVSGNQASGGEIQARGGGVFNAGGTLTLSGARIVANSVDVAVDEGSAWGGGLYSAGGTVLMFASSEIADNEVVATGTDAFAVGGGVAADMAEIISTGGDRIGGNVARAEGMAESSAWASGGGLYLTDSSLEMVGGGLVEANRAEVTGAPVAFFFGVSAEGGGIYGSRSSIVFDGAAVLDNEALAGCIDCDAGTRGGGLHVSSSTTVSMTMSTLAGNRATTDAMVGRAAEGYASAFGGGIYGRVGTGTDTVLIQLVDSLVDGNRASVTAMGRDTGGTAYGGAAYISSGTGNAEITFRLERSLVVDNHAEGSTSAIGGGVYARSGTGEAQTWVAAVNTTFSGNSSATADASGSARGGALYFGDGISLAFTHGQFHNVTITQNTAEEGGGVYVLGEQLEVQLSDSIVEGNTAALDPDLRCSGGNIDSQGYNLLGATGSCSSSSNDIVGQDALLLPLADNGGPTPTHAIAPMSLARDGGNPRGCTNEDGFDLVVDQRGEPRPAEVACDIGAFEHQP